MLRYEAWPVPGDTPYTVRVRDLQPASGTGLLPRTPYGNGAIELAKNKTRVDGTSLLDAVAYADTVTPANDVASLIRVYRPGETDEQAPIHEWLIEDPVAENDDLGVVRLSGRNIEAILDYEHVEVWDWDGSTTFLSQFPDHVYGGRNLIRNSGLEELQHQVEIYELWNDQVAASTFTLTVEGATTAAIAFNAIASVVEAAIEATAGITDCRVTGAGTEADPWRIEFDTPFDITPDMSVTDAGGLTSTLARTQQGRFTTEPFTISQTIAQGVNWVHGDLEPGHPFISTAVVRTGTYSIGFNGINQYAGIQTVINVTPGGTYQASMWARTADTAATWRLVIRTPTEELIASTTFTGTALAANTWTQFAIANIAIPDGVTQIVMRFAYIGTGNPGTVYTDDWAFNEGLAAASAGAILTDLFDDAQTDHAPTRAALTFINLDFTTALDSDGTAWPTTSLSITIKRGETYLQMMRQLEKLGYEWRLTPTAATPGEWDLQVYGPGGMGTNHTGLDDPAIVIGQGTLPSNVTRQKPGANYLFAEGYGGITTRTSDAGSIGAVGRRTAAVKDTRFTDSVDLATWAGARLSDYLAEVLAPRITLTEPNDADDWPRPLDEYAPGDTIDYVLIGTSVSRRIERVSYNHTTEDLVWTVEGGTANPFVGPAPTASGGGSSVSGHQQLNVLGTAVRQILEEFRFSDDTAPVDQPLLSGLGGLPAFTVRVAASDARAESKAAADFLCVGSNDQYIIDQALAICTGLGFGDVVLSEGTFYIDRTWTTGSVGRLRGLGIDQTTLSMQSITLTLNVAVADFTIVEVDPCAT